MDLIEKIALYLGFSKEQIVKHSKRCSKTYRLYKIPKKGKLTGFRTIYHPAKETKAIQYALMEILLGDFKVSESAIAYKRGLSSPLRENALLHAPYKYSVRIDFENFFLSLQPRDLARMAKSKFDLNDKEIDFLIKSLFVDLGSGRSGLGVGAPSSPMVSNIIMYELDEEIQKIALKIDPKSVYSRYADDIIFSTDQKGACKQFYDQLASVIKSSKSPRLKINDLKTIFSSRGSRRMITGLIVTPNGDVSIGRRNKRYIKKLLFDFSKSKISDKNKSYLKGYLSYIEDVEPDFLNSLSLKYGAALLEKIRMDQF